jgi:hypothetical protein
VEGECYNDQIGECQNPEHVAGIAKMIKIRKRAHIYHALKSLLPEMRQVVLEKVWRYPESRPFLPHCWSSDYRTYHPDAVRATLDQARTVLESDEGEDEVRQLASDIVNKAASLEFFDFNYPMLAPRYSDPKEEQKSKKPKPIDLRPRHEILFEQFKARYLKRPFKIASNTKKTSVASSKRNVVIHVRT